MDLPAEGPAVKQAILTSGLGERPQCSSTTELHSQLRFDLKEKKPHRIIFLIPPRCWNCDDLHSDINLN